MQNRLVKEILYTGFARSTQDWYLGPFTFQLTLPWTIEGNCQLYLGVTERIITICLHTQAFIRFKILRVLKRRFNAEFSPPFCFNLHSFLLKEVFREIRHLLCYRQYKKNNHHIYITISRSSNTFTLCSIGFCPPWAHLWAPVLWFNCPSQTPHLLLLSPEWVRPSTRYVFATKVSAHWGSPPHLTR